MKARAAHALPKELIPEGLRSDANFTAAGCKHGDMDERASTFFAFQNTLSERMRRAVISEGVICLCCRADRQNCRTAVCTYLLGSFIRSEGGAAL